MEKDNIRVLFVAAAIFNWVVGLGLFFIPGLFLSLFGITPLPEQSLWVQLFASLVFFFGIAYYQASVDLPRHRNIIKLAVWAKTGVLLIGLMNVVNGDVSWHFLIPASADGVFAVLFLMALNSEVGHSTVPNS
jgi:hypothetical protein